MESLSVDISKTSRNFLRSLENILGTINRPIWRLQASGPSTGGLVPHLYKSHTATSRLTRYSPSKVPVRMIVHSLVIIYRKRDKNVPGVHRSECFTVHPSAKIE
jgi:hypothetical protein